jgi:hypothetical protein
MLPLQRGAADNQICVLLQTTNASLAAKRSQNSGRRPCLINMVIVVFVFVAK